MLAAAILAAGESRRMGSPKALSSIRGRTFLERLWAATRHPRIGFTRVILGAGAADIQQKLTVDAATIVVNPDWRRGQLSSIRAALRSLSEGATEGLLLCPIDHPLISNALVASLIECFDSTGKQIVLPVFRGRRGHPVIFRESLYAELLEAPVDIGARKVVWDHAAEVAEVSTNEEAVVLNLDDPDSLRHAIDEYRNKGEG